MQISYASSNTALPSLWEQCVPRRTAVYQQHCAAVDVGAAVRLRAVVDDGAVGARARDGREAGLHKARLRRAAARQVLVHAHLCQLRTRSHLIAYTSWHVSSVYAPTP